MRAPRQLVFDLASRPALGRADFFVSEANRLALAQVDLWPTWPEGRLAVAGPAGSGKTHLAHVWASASGARILPAEALPGLDVGTVGGAVVVEDADRLEARGDGDRRAGEEALFHLANRSSVDGAALMITGRLPPAHWDIGLPDLASRLRAAPVARLEAPDDQLLGAVLVKLFSDRQILVAPRLIGFLLARMDRSLEAAETIVARLDRAGLARHRPITARLAAEILYNADQS